MNQIILLLSKIDFWADTFFQKWQKSFKFRVGIITVLFFMALFLGLLYQFINNFSFERDEVTYLYRITHYNYLTDIAKGTLPLLVVLGNFFYVIGFDPEWTLRIINLLCFATNCLIIYFICNMVFNNKVALLGMLFAVFNPYAIRMSCTILREPIYILLISLIVLMCVIFLKRKSYLSLGLASFIVPFAFFARYEGLETIAIIGIFILISLFNEGKKRSVHLLKSCGIAFIMLMIGFRIMDIMVPQKLESSFIKFKGVWEVNR